MRKFLTMACVLALAASCTQDTSEVGGAEFGNLDETGRQFIEMLQKRPDWQTEWAEMNEHGQPLPNEMIVISSMGSDLTFCFVPVVDAKDPKQVVRMVVAPLVRDTTTNILRLGAPKIFDEEGVDKDSVARSFIGLDFVKRWHNRGLEFDVELTPSPEPTSTRSSLQYENGFRVFYTLNIRASAVAQAESWFNREGEYFIQNYNPYPEGMTIWRPHYNGANWHVTMYYNTADMPPVSIHIGAEGLFLSYLDGLRDRLEQIAYFSQYSGSIYDVKATKEYMWYIPSMGGGALGVDHSNDCEGSCGCAEQFCYCETCDNCLIPIESIKINVSASSVVCLGEGYTVSITQSPQNTTESISSVDYVVNDGTKDFYLGNVYNGGSLNFTAKTPGNYKFKATATIDGGSRMIESEYSRSIIHQFPYVSDIINNPVVIGQMELLWAETIRPPHLTSTQRTELGAWIYFDTRTNYYEFDTSGITLVPNSTSEASTINSGSVPADYVESGLQGGRYVVAFFHTHTSSEYQPLGRIVGISNADHAQALAKKIPVIAYDYLETTTNSLWQPIILGGHPATDPAMPYYDLEQLVREY